MATNLPSTAMLRVFDAAMEEGGFAKAGARLNLTTAAVSYQIRTLETLLRKTLFERRPGGVVPTADARALHPDAKDILDRLQRFGATGARVPGVRLLAAQSFASLWLLPRMGELAAAFPQSRFEVISWTGGRVRKPTLEEVVPIADIEIRWAGPDMDFGPLSVAKLAHDSAVPLCSRAYLDRLGGTLTAESLRGATILTALNWPDIWPTWCRAAFGTELVVKTAVQLQQTALCIQAAASDVGIAMAHGPLADRELSGGRLVRASDVVYRVREAYYAVRRRSFADEALFRRFAAWCRAQLAERR